jgi:hypothetical protein
MTYPRTHIMRALFALTAFLLLAGVSFAQQYKTLGPGSCGTGNTDCHAKETKNMIDKHKNAVDNLNTSDRLDEILTKYGVDKNKYLVGSGKCMTCHGTVVTDKANAEVEEGVSCESCHGPGSAYKDNHKEAKGKGFAFGLLDLGNVDRRGDACVRCHYVTEQKLINAGHPAGERFNYLAGMKSVAKHWKRAATDNDLKNRQPFDNAKAKRGTVKLVNATPAKAIPADAGGNTEQAAERPTPARPIPPPRPVAASPVVVESVGPIELPPFPAIGDSASVDEILLTVKQRLELLYQKTSKNR